MMSLLRLLLALVTATIIALPIISSDGGENGGGTGIWILPRARFLCAGPAPAPLDSKNLATLSVDLVMQVSAECGACVATLIDEVSGVPVSLPAVGSRIRLSAALLQVVASGGGRASIVILDSSGLGYSLKVTTSSSGGATIAVY